MLHFALVAVATAASLSAGWKAGAAAQDITPTEPVWMSGYANRTRPSEGVRQRIRAKALAIEDDSGAVSVLVTLDLLGIRRDMSEAIAERVKRDHGIPRERILFNASHTHSAPLVGEWRNYADRHGKLFEGQAAPSERYTEWVAGRINAAIDAALAARVPVTAAFDQGFAGFAVNRRRVGHREYPGPVDHDVPVLALRKADGSLLAIVFGYACHNTVMADYLIHGDYAGYAQEWIETRHPGAQAMFVQGAGADSNPLPRRKVEHLERYGATLADAVDEVLRGKMKPVTGGLSAAIAFPEIRFERHTRAEFEQKAKGDDLTLKLHAQRQLEALDRDGKFTEAYPYAIQAWRFGGAVTLIALGGELVVDYSLKLKAQYGWDRTWVAGYSNDVLGYIPSRRVWEEGGYEGGEAYQFGMFPGRLEGDVETRILTAVEQMMGALR